MLNMLSNSLSVLTNNTITIYFISSKTKKYAWNHMQQYQYKTECQTAYVVGAEENILA
jgi:hypothetical protein